MIMKMSIGVASAVKLLNVEKNLIAKTVSLGVQETAIYYVKYRERRGDRK